MPCKGSTEVINHFVAASYQVFKKTFEKEACIGLTMQEMAEKVPVGDEFPFNL